MKKQCNSIVDLLKEIERNNDAYLRVIGNGDGLPAYRKRSGAVTIKLTDQRTYTISHELYKRIKPYLIPQPF